jgi:two-component system LytT family response regulator
MAEIALFKGNRKKIVRYDDILYLAADDKYTEVVLITGEKLYSSKCLKCMEDGFPENCIFRIHRKYSINLQHLSEYSLNCENFVIMRNGVKIPVAARKRHAFSVKVMDFIHENRDHSFTFTPETDTLTAFFGFLLTWLI